MRLSDRMDEDVLAWFYEKSGLFTVRSAYKLGLSIERENERQTGSSMQGDAIEPCGKTSGVLRYDRKYQFSIGN